MVICIRSIESRIWAEYFRVESFDMNCGLICTKVWDAWGGSEEAVYPTDIPPKSLLHIKLWFRIEMGIFTLTDSHSSLWCTHCSFTQIFQLIEYWRNVWLSVIVIWYVDSLSHTVALLIIWIYPLACWLMCFRFHSLRWRKGFGRWCSLYDTQLPCITVWHTVINHLF